MSGWTGTEVCVRDLALRLRRRGHDVMVYTYACGPLADQLAQLSIPVETSLDAFTTPDVIHGQHQLVIDALQQYPDVPAIFYCHGAEHPLEAPPLSDRILRYIAVDEPCRKRVEDAGIASVRLLLNAVDLKRFVPRTAVSDVPRRALVFSNYMREENLGEIRDACARAGVELDAVGLSLGCATKEPELLLPTYDLVFAKARAALEALAVGCAVILCDRVGLGTLVTPREFDRLRALNLGFRTLTAPITSASVLEQIRRYSSAEVAAVTKRVRAEASLDDHVDALEAVYAEVIAESRERRSLDATALPATR